MARRKEPTPLKESKRKIRPATTPDARENQLIALAYDVVEQRLLDGTATSQETTALIKLGSLKTRLEIEKLKKDTELANAKTEVLKSEKRREEVYLKALEAMRTYSGSLNVEVDDDPYIL